MESVPGDLKKRSTFWVFSMLWYGIHALSFNPTHTLFFPGFTFLYGAPRRGKFIVHSFSAWTFDNSTWFTAFSGSTSNSLSTATCAKSRSMWALQEAKRDPHIDGVA
ncbi:hypothetical protein MLD38_009854 [Melastoma candidum]|uniref:Uncharacterized protein n=1 Tax=Melastoma candidum TaxID=119954 RepID=A0ACB9RYK4_9MYRT|nr:hypothetical protein MLD38_009854 [Melastoma candidum]